jgi:hypothetical protein
MAKKKRVAKSATKTIPTQTDVAFRALALLALLGRTQAEMEIQQDPDVRDQWKRVNDQIKTWCNDEGITPHQSKAEQKLLSKRFGGWTESEVVESIWRTEALAALLWALGKFKEMPVYTQAVDSSSVWKLIPIMEPTKPFLKSIKLRSRKVIEAECGAAEFWHWRARTEMLRRSEFTPPEGDTFEACIKRAAESAVKQGIVSKMVAGDVPARGKSYGKLTQEQSANAHSVAVERHFALNWLCGYSNRGDWDSTQTDT